MSLKTGKNGIYDWHNLTIFRSLVADGVADCFLDLALSKGALSLLV
jgi:predicted RNA methylase